jgi:hypothetical protein
MPPCASHRIWVLLLDVDIEERLTTPAGKAPASAEVDGLGWGKSLAVLGLFARAVWNWPSEVILLFLVFEIVLIRWE